MSHSPASCKVSFCLGGVNRIISIKGIDEGDRLTLAACILPQSLLICSRRFLTSSEKIKDTRRPMLLEIL